MQLNTFEHHLLAPPFLGSSNNYWCRIPSHSIPAVGHLPMRIAGRSPIRVAKPQDPLNKSILRTWNSLKGASELDWMARLTSLMKEKTWQAEIDAAGRASPVEGSYTYATRLLEGLEIPFEQVLGEMSGPFKEVAAWGMRAAAWLRENGKEQRPVGQFFDFYEDWVSFPREYRSVVYTMCVCTVFRYGAVFGSLAAREDSPLWMIRKSHELLIPATKSWVSLMGYLYDIPFEFPKSFNPGINWDRVYKDHLSWRKDHEVSIGRFRREGTRRIISESSELGCISEGDETTSEKPSSSGTRPPSTPSGARPNSDE